MAYTPELSQIGSAILRRLAWYLQKPMTKSLEVLIELTAMKMAEVRPGRSVISVEMTVFVSSVHSTPPPHTTETCEMSGLVLLKGETSCKNVRISLWF